MASNTGKTNPVALYEEHLKSNKFVFVVYYRGHWCPFCRSYLKTLQKLSAAIAAEGGKVIAVTAETADHLQETRDLTGYTGEVIVDAENLLAAELKRQGKVNVAITERDNYKHGMAQPALLVANSKGKTYESWAIVPSEMNLGGAKDRPELSQVWENVKAEMSGRAKIHEKYLLQSSFDEYS